MKSKTSYLFLSTLIIALISLTLVSAGFSITTTPASLSKSTASSYFIIKNTNMTSDLAVNIGSFSQIKDSSNHILNVVASPTSIIIPNNTEYRVNLTYTGDTSNFDLGTFTSTGNVTDGSNTQQVSVSFTSSFCSAGEKNYSQLDFDVDYEVTSGFGEDEDWYPMDVVEVKVNVDNIGNSDLEDLTLEWCLYDNDARKCIFENEEDTFDLDEDDDTDITFTIELDPEEIDSSNKDYSLYIKVYGDDQEKFCKEERSASVNLILEKHFVVLGKVEIPESTVCGGLLDISGKVWNIGSSDESDVYMYLINKELRLNEKIELGDIDSFDSKSFNFEFEVPKNASEKTYNLEFNIYDDSDDLYESDDNEASFVRTVKVEDCKSNIKSAAISAELSSETPRAIIGSQVIVEATVKNTGSTQTSYTLDISGNTAWSTVAEIDPKTFTLNAGESKKVNIYLDISNNAEAGDKEFTIRTAQSGYTTDQKVQLTLEKGFSSSALLNHLRANWYLYAIGIVIIVLVILILVVLRNIVKRTSN